MQDSKNLLLAVVLCLAILFGWGYVTEYMGWTPKPVEDQDARQKEEERKAIERAQQDRLAQELAAQPVFTPSEGRDFTVNTPIYEAILHTGGGPLRSFRLKKYQSGLAPDSPLVNLVDERAASVAPLGLVINGQPSWSTGKWTAETEADSLDLTGQEKGRLVLNGLVAGLQVRRELEFSADTYLIHEKILVINTGDRPANLSIGCTAAMSSSIGSGGQYDGLRIAWDQDGSLDEEKSEKTLESTGIQAQGKIYWGGPMSTYFLSAVLPGEIDGVTVKGLLQNSIYRASVEQAGRYIAPGDHQAISVSYWLGPKVRSELAAVSEQLAKSIDLGMFSIIAKALLLILETFHRYVHNWGVAIILLTVVIKAVFWPLTAKSYSSMEKMKQLQPLMQGIREKYKDDKEMMNKEVMNLYKTYGVNPASGCLPILIQLPVFFGLYQALLTSIALRHASFITYLPGTDIIWLADLSAKDPLYITPIVMGITMFLQQRLSPPATDPTQQKVMMFLPLIFTALFISFPAGLVLYWLANNILSIFQQWMMMRKNRKLAPVK